MVATDMIKQKIRESGRTQKAIADEMGISQATLSLKINNERPLYLDEACVLAEILGIKKEFFAYFFAKKSCTAQRLTGE